MSYLKQKKQKKQENILFRTLALILILITVNGFFDAQNNQTLHQINNFRIQIYAITILFLFFSILKRRILGIIIGTILVLINYGIISTYTNVLKNIEIKDGQEINVNYTNQSLNDSYSKSSLIFSKQSIAPKFDVTTKDHNNIVILVDFSKEPNINNALNKLKNFILTQDDPIIIVGNFGYPLWHPEMKDFLEKTGLKSKNKLIIETINPLYIPVINVLGFSNSGVKEIIQQKDNLSFILLAK